MKVCPKCNDKLSPENMICDCGYDFTKMDCPGCDERIPDDSVICRYCKYNLVENKAYKPKRDSAEDDIAIPSVLISAGKSGGEGVKRRGRKREEEEVEPVEPVEVKSHKTGLRLCHSYAPGQLGVPDPNYGEMYWQKGQEVTDDSLLEWAEAFRLAYRTKVKNREDCHLSNYCISSWCHSSSQWQAKRHNKEGQNDVLVKNADRILKLLGGNDYRPDNKTSEED